MRFYSLKFVYSVTGLVLGVGAPVGAFFFRLILLPTVRAAPLEDIANNSFFYLYQLIGTSLVFAAAGWVAGNRAEQLRRAESFYHTLSEHDPLTGLYNARAFRDRYARALERAERKQGPLSLVLVDVDGLKRINDRFGHIVGNDALVFVANGVRDSKRKEDFAARWGGDEFAVLLGGGDASAARRVAENLLQRMHERPLHHDRGDIPVTVTIGVCTARHPNSGDDLFAAADRALYEGKSAGRDRASFVELGREAVSS